MATENSPPTATDAAANDGGVNSPLSRPQRNLASPWASVVRGDVDQIISSPVSDDNAPNRGFSPSPPPQEMVDNSQSGSVPEAQPELISDVNINEDSNSNAGGQPRRPAWNRPSNGVVEPVSVMGGIVSWPALSESTMRGVPRPSSDSPRPVSDGSVSTSQAPIISQPPQRPANNNGHPNSTANNSASSRPRPRNRSGGHSGSGPSQNSFNRPSPPVPPPFPVFEVPYGVVPAVLDTPVRGARPAGGAGGSQSHTGTDHSSHRVNSRRGNYGPRPRGDGNFQNEHRGRRDQERRDVHLPPQFVPPPTPIGYMPPALPPGAAPFMAPPRMPVFPGQMGFEMGSPFFYVPTIPPESFRGVPIVPPAPPVVFPPPNENPLTDRIVKQIDFYFSDDNLVKDRFLRSNMDAHGWVQISVIASFRRVQMLTNDVPLILESLRHSTLVEVQGDKVRRRDSWSKWLFSSGGSSSDSGSHSQEPRDAAPETVLAASLQGVSLNETMMNANGNVDLNERSLPEDSTAEADSISR